VTVSAGKGRRTGYKAPQRPRSGGSGSFGLGAALTVAVVLFAVWLAAKGGMLSGSHAPTVHLSPTVHRSAPAHRSAAPKPVKR
jgi:hypothetical protein